MIDTLYIGIAHEQALAHLVILPTRSGFLARLWYRQNQRDSWRIVGSRATTQHCRHRPDTVGRINVNLAETGETNSNPSSPNDKHQENLANDHCTHDLDTATYKVTLLRQNSHN